MFSDDSRTRPSRDKDLPRPQRGKRPGTVKDGSEREWLLAYQIQRVGNHIHLTDGSALYDGEYVWCHFSSDLIDALLRRSHSPKVEVTASFQIFIVDSDQGQMCGCEELSKNEWLGFIYQTRSVRSEIKSMTTCLPRFCKDKSGELVFEGNPCDEASNDWMRSKLHLDWRSVLTPVVEGFIETEVFTLDDINNPQQLHALNEFKEKWQARHSQLCSSRF